MRDYVLDGSRRAKFCSDRFKGFFPKYAILPSFGVTSFLFVFFAFFDKATVYTHEKIFTQNTSNDVGPGKEVHFGGLSDYILY